MGLQELISINCAHKQRNQWLDALLGAQAGKSKSADGAANGANDDPFGSSKDEALLSKKGSLATDVDAMPTLLAAMADPRDIWAFGGTLVGLILALGHEQLLGLDAAAAVQVLYPLILANSFLAWSSEHCGHVDWLLDSGYTKRRGLSKWASALYGFLQPPGLSLCQFAWVYLALVLSLFYVAVHPEYTPVCFVLVILIMSHLFFNRANIGGHGGLPVFHTLFCLSMQTEENMGAVILCVQVNLCSFYFSCFLCKLFTTLCLQRPRLWWGRGASFKFYLLDNISIRPMAGFRKWVRDFLLRTGSATLGGLMMNFWLVFALCSPGLIFLQPQLAAVALWIFHYATWFFFDIDFLSFWGPSMIILAVQTPTMMMGLLDDYGEGLFAAYEAAPVRTGLMLAYTAIQVVVGLMVYDLNPHLKELLPFSAYPMFEESTTIFEPSQAMALVLRVPTATSVPEPYYLRMQALSTTPNEHYATGLAVVEKARHRMLVIGIPKRPPVEGESIKGGCLDKCCGAIAKMCCSGGCCSTADGEHSLNHERENDAKAGTVMIVGNLDITPAMEELRSLLVILTTYVPSDAWKPKRMQAMLDAFDAMQAALEKCPRVASYRQELLGSTNPPFQPTGAPERAAPNEEEESSYCVLA
eukprot:TRINITY_DN73630_c0_g1_i1.p1 TRINITY_DN73630_c0_g1~~TRINITY_DN73630_c0_g1_i1.p1  ORF type:complete len:641 (+),score=103.68 TRINITY_DN73630_c0_g1_i1:70-1992(+)